MASSSVTGTCRRGTHLERLEPWPDRPPPTMPTWAFGSEATSSGAWPGRPSPTCSTSAGPFGRLALTHVLMTAGDTLFAVSLAGSLFFSISPTAAKDKVLLYLLLTMGPFAVVAPALGPLIDRSRGARRAMVVASALGRAVLCPFVARDIHSLLLFPEAFAMLVLSKVYLVTKGALVPEMAALEHAGEPASGAARPGSPMRRRPDAGGARPVRSAPERRRSHAALRHAGRPRSTTRRPASDVVEPDLATLNARLGPAGLAVGLRLRPPRRRHLQAGRRARRALGRHRRVRGRRGRRGPAAGPPAGPGADAGRGGRPSARRRTWPTPEVALRARCSTNVGGPTTQEDLAAFRPIAGHRGHPGADADVGAEGAARLPHLPVRLRPAPRGRGHLVVRARCSGRSPPGRSSGCCWWRGSGGTFDEQQMLTGSPVAGGRRRPSLGGLLHAAPGSRRWWPSRSALAGAVAKPSFDALVQRHVRESDQGRAFARFETRLQLMWVVGSFVAGGAVAAGPGRQPGHGRGGRAGGARPT